MPGAFCHGMVKNQQGLAAEALQIGASAKPPLLNSQHSRDKLNSASTAHLK
jgi:hypothetical protein